MIVVSLPIRHFDIFLRNSSLVFSELWHYGRYFEYLKADSALFSEKIIFTQI